jgi:hypothetical protein
MALYCKYKTQRITNNSLFRCIYYIVYVYKYLIPHINYLIDLNNIFIRSYYLIIDFRMIELYYLLNCYSRLSFGYFIIVVLFMAVSIMVLEMVNYD